MYQVVDAAGRVIELDDDEIVPRGCSLRVPVEFMDAEQRANARAADRRYAIDDAQRLHTLDAYLDMKDRVSRGMRRHQVPTPEPADVADGEFDHRTAAYDAMKRRLSGAHKARKARKVVDPQWGRL